MNAVSADIPVQVVVFFWWGSQVTGYQHRYDKGIDGDDSRHHHGDERLLTDVG